MYPVLENRPVWIEVDIAQFKANLTYAKQLAGDKEIWAVVKSDGYNHGIEHLLPHFLDLGITHFCVSQYDEALHLQSVAHALGQAIELLIFGNVPAEKIGEIPENWHLTIADLASIEQYTNYLANNPQQRVAVQLKIDSGMNRRGFKVQEEFVQAFKRLKANEQYRLTGLYTHFATADSDVAFMKKQVQRFLEISGDYVTDVPSVHAQNSSGLLHLGAEAMHFNAVRLGGILYGMTGEPHVAVQPIFQLYGQIIEVKSVKKGETIGYGNTHRFEHDGYIGLIPIGYADGWRKTNQNLSVYVNGKRVQIVGRISMEQTAIFAEDPLFTLGDTVEFVGQHNSMYTVAKHNEMTDYEFVCGFLPRVMKKYTE